MFLSLNVMNVQSVEVVCAEASLLKRRADGVTVSQTLDAKQELDSLYALLEQPWNTSSNQSTADGAKTEKKFVTFEGIGPTDEQTGVPIATRTVSI